MAVSPARDERVDDVAEVGHLTPEAAVSRIDDWKGKDVRYEELGGGITNHNYIVWVNGGAGNPGGAKYVMRHLYENGVWAIFSTLDPRVLQFKPGILLKPELAEELLDRVEVAIGRAWREVSAPGSRRAAQRVTA